MLNSISKLGYAVTNSNSNMFLIRDCDLNFIKKLDEHDISLVKIHNYDGQTFLRVAIQDHNINKKFISELKKIKKRCKDV